MTRRELGSGAVGEHCSWAGLGWAGLLGWARPRYKLLVDTADCCRVLHAHTAPRYLLDTAHISSVILHHYWDPEQQREGRCFS